MIKIEEEDEVMLLRIGQLDLKEIAKAVVVDPPLTEKSIAGAKNENLANHGQPSPLCILEDSDDDFVVVVVI